MPSTLWHSDDGKLINDLLLEILCRNMDKALAFSNHIDVRQLKAFP